MPYDPEKHDRRSIRLKDYDYAQSGGYFVTICTQGWKCLFGKVVDEEMRLGQYGHMVQTCWEALPGRYTHIMLDAFVVMPNHMHGILIITDPNISAVGAGSPRPYSTESTQRDEEPLRLHTLGQMVAYFKYQSTKHINQMRRTPGTKVWQRNYWERIIRGGDEMDRMRQYIDENPARWYGDRLYVE